MEATKTLLHQHTWKEVKPKLEGQIRLTHADYASPELNQLSNKKVSNTCIIFH